MAFDQAAYIKQWRADNAVRLAAYEAERRHLPHRKLFAQEGHRARRYGLVKGEYDTMLAAQGGVCALCGRNDNGGKAFAVDHDHSTGRVRGLLCDLCNRGLGWLETLDAAKVEAYRG